MELDSNSLKLILFTDAAFANSKNLGSQLGFVLILADETGRCNIDHDGSVRCRRVTRSVMAAEVLALVFGFDNSYIVKHTIDKAMGKEIPLETYTDSPTLFNTIAKASN